MCAPLSLVVAEVPARVCARRQPRHGRASAPTLGSSGASPGAPQMHARRTATRRFATTRRSATAARRRSSRSTARSTGSACRTSTRRRCSAGCSTRGAAARSSSCPSEPFEAERAYEHGSNVLVTTFRTASGSVRVTDALTLADERLAPLRELVRQVDGLSGRSPIALAHRAALRLRRAGRADRAGARDGCSRSARHLALALDSWDAGEPRVDGGAVAGEFTTEPGLARAARARGRAHAAGRALAAASASRTGSSGRGAFWPRWAARARATTARGASAVVRSALALKLLVYAPSGAIVAAPTTSLPEQLGGDKNWDYRYAWLRDASYTLDALIKLGYRDEARAFFWWQMNASRRRHPRLRTLYRVDGSPRVPECELRSTATRARGPCASATRAASQLQLDVYGGLLDAALALRDRGRRARPRHGRAGGRDRRLRRRARGASRTPASGRTAAAAAAHAVDRDVLGRARPRLAARRARRRAATTATAGSARRTRRALPARALLRRRARHLHALPRQPASSTRACSRSRSTAASDAADERMLGTIDALRRELGDGPLLARYGTLGARRARSSPCSFWLAGRARPRRPRRRGGAS